MKMYMYFYTGEIFEKCSVRACGNEQLFCTQRTLGGTPNELIAEALLPFSPLWSLKIHFTRKTASICCSCVPMCTL